MSDYNQYDIEKGPAHQGEEQAPCDVEYGPGLQEIPEAEKAPSQGYVPDLERDTNIDSFIQEQEKIDKKRNGGDRPN